MSDFVVTPLCGRTDGANRRESERSETWTFGHSRVLPERWPEKEREKESS